MRVEEKSARRFFLLPAPSRERWREEDDAMESKKLSTENGGHVFSSPKATRRRVVIHKTMDLVER